jgi:mannose-6-phosphate isomerase-like protein (cupin superfamily)
MRKWMPALVAVFALATLSGQEVQPSCKMCPGTYIPKSELDAYLKRAIANNIVDQQVRHVDIGKAHLGLGMVHRGKLTNPEPAVAEHDLVSELYHIIDGTATLVLGPDLVGMERRPASQKTVRVQNGLGNGAKQIRNGVAYELKKGDVVIIPAGTGHLFTKIDDHITYIMARFDPDKIVPLKTEADSKADLSTSGTETPEEAAAAGKKFAHLGRHYDPNCKMCPGTYIPASEINAYIKRGIANGLTDQGVRQVDIGRVNVGVAVVTRPKLATAEANVAEHDLVSELYHVIDGAATLKLGPDLVGKERRPANLATVRLLNGPGNNAKEIRNGVSYNIKAGDVVIIPAGTGHQFTRIDDHVTYLMVRIDADKVTPHKTEADSKADLLTDGRATAGGGAGAASAPGR